MVSACPTCTVALEHEFISTFESLGQTEWMDRPGNWPQRQSISRPCVKKLVDEGRLTLKEGQQLGKFTYHDSCHLKRTLKVSETAAGTAAEGRL